MPRSLTGVNGGGSTLHGLPIEVQVGNDKGLKHACAVSLDHVCTVEKSALRAWVGRLDER